MYNNLIDDADAVTATNELAGFPDSNLNEEWKYPSILWKSNNDIADVSIVIDFGAAKEVAGFALLNLNFASATATTKVIQAHTADAWGAPDESANLIIYTRTINGVARYDAYYIPSAAWNKQFYRYNFTLGAGTLISAGTPFLAQDVNTVSKGTASNENGLLISERNIIHESENEDPLITGHISRIVNNASRELGLDYTGVTTAQKELFMDMQESDNACFLPYGDGSKILYFGIVKFGEFEPVDTKASPHYRGGGIFREVKK